MANTYRHRAWLLEFLSFLAGALLAAAWWDWTVEGQIALWWRGDHIYASSWQRLGSLFLVAQVAWLLRKVSKS